MQREAARARVPLNLSNESPKNLWRASINCQEFFQSGPNVCSSPAEDARATKILDARGEQAYSSARFGKTVSSLRVVTRGRGSGHSLGAGSNAPACSTAPDSLSRVTSSTSMMGAIQLVTGLR